MLYTSQITIPKEGIIRIGTIGGSPDKVIGNNRYQIGYETPVRYGILNIFLSELDNNLIHDVTLTAQGYGSNFYEQFKCPGSIYIEMPCSLIIKGPEGLNLIIEAWEVSGVITRGAQRSHNGADTNIVIPRWAENFDLAGATATFKDRLGNTTGEVSGNVVGFSIPDKSVTVDLVDLAPGKALIVFRQ
jgi:hypothetical protein